MNQLFKKIIISILAAFLMISNALTIYAAAESDEGYANKAYTEVYEEGDYIIYDDVIFDEDYNEDANVEAANASGITIHCKLAVSTNKTVARAITASSGGVAYYLAAKAKVVCSSSTSQTRYKEKYNATSCGSDKVTCYMTKKTFYGYHKWRKTKDASVKKHVTTKTIG